MAAGKSTKNTHLEHLEDDIINLGYKGAQQSIAFVEALLQLFAGDSTTKVDVTVKWDGAPAVVVGKDPETGYFFVATKHGAFAKNMKLGFNEELIDHYYGTGPAEVLKIVYRELKDLNWTDVLQGDVMFTPQIKKHQVIDGIQYVTFKPNTILYAVPVSDPLGEKVTHSNLGIVFHTKYSGSQVVNEMSASFGVDVSKLKSKTAWIQDASYKDMSGKMTLTSQETKTVSASLASAKSNAKGLRTFLDMLSKQIDPLSIGYLFKIFVNRLVRENVPITSKSLSGLENFVVARITEKEQGVKTAAAKERYAGLRKETQKFMKDNTVNIRSLFTLYTDLLTIKNILVKKLNEVQGISTFIETPEGFRATDPEGYVAIDKKGNAVKLVNRMEFSSANFNAVKDWQKSPSVVESKKDLKTIVFAFGRLNPPTIGHKKLIDKVIEVARNEKADHLIVLSKTHKSPKDPLDPKTKLMYAKKMFTNVNLDVATDTKSDPIKWIKEFNGKYDKIIWIAGSDRVPEYVRLLTKYNGTELFTFKIADVLSAGERDADADDASGMSASKMRGYAKNNDFTNFKKGVPSTLRESDAKKLMELVQQGME